MALVPKTPAPPPPRRLAFGMHHQPQHATPARHTPHTPLLHLHAHLFAAAQLHPHDSWSGARVIELRNNAGDRGTDEYAPPLSLNLTDHGSGNLRRAAVRVGSPLHEVVVQRWHQPVLNVIRCHAWDLSGWGNKEGKG